MKARTIEYIGKLLKERDAQSLDAWIKASGELHRFEQSHGFSEEDRIDRGRRRDVSESIRAEYTKLVDREFMLSMEHSATFLCRRDFSDHEWK